MQRIKIDVKASRIQVRVAAACTILLLIDRMLTIEAN